MKKSTMRVLSLVMALMMIVGTLAVVPFSADANNQQPAQTAGQHDKHTKGELVETVAPTCGLYGYSVYKCAEEGCGISFITDITEKLEHDWEEVGEVLATCDAKGHDAYYLCKNCGAKTLDPDTAVLLADDAKELNRPEDHDTAESYKINDPDDCTAGVYYVKYCKKCGKVLDENVVTIVEKGTVEHELYAEVTVEATCQATGLANLYCKKCSFTLEDVIVEKLNHKPVDDKKDNWKTIPATFLDREINYLPCELCGEIILNEKGKFDKIVKENNINKAYVTVEDKDGNKSDIYVAKIGDNNIADLLNIDLAGDWDQLEPGKSKTYTEEFNEETITFTMTKPACEHKYNDAPDYYAFEYETVVEGKKTKVEVRSDDKENDTAKYPTPGKFIEEYAKHVDVADLYAVYTCKDNTKTGLPKNNEKLPDSYNVFKGFKVGCEKTNNVVLLKAVGHQYADYTFEFKYDLNPKATDDSSLVSYFHPFTGGKQEVVYACGAKATSTITCSICKETIEKQVGNTMNHKYVTVCQNEECKENKAYNLSTEENPIYLYECTNCTHARKDVCFNLVGTKTPLEDNRAYCLACVAYKDENSDGKADKENDEYVTVEKTRDTYENNEAYLADFYSIDHDFDETDTVHVDATCTEYAYDAFKCKNCEQLKQDVDSIDVEGGYDKTNHDWTIKADKSNYVVDRSQPATCVTKGRYVIVCNRFNCTETSEYFEIPEDPDNHRNLAYPIGLNAPLTCEATCTTPKMEKWYCWDCKSTVYKVVLEDEEEEPELNPNNHVDIDSISATNPNGVSTIETVKAKPQTCTSDGNYAYKYCTACGVITAIDFNDDGDFTGEGETPAQGKTWTVEEDINKTVRPVAARADVDGWIKNDNPLTFTARQWKDAYAGDTNIEYEVVKFATGDTMFYRITSGGTGHKLEVKPEDKAVEATCYEDGQNARAICSVCGYKDPVRNGAKIAKLGHPNAVKIERPDDENVEIKEGTVIVRSTDLKAVAIWTLRGAKEIDRKDKNGYQEITYKYEYVEATCEEDGYIIGTYCPDCMNLIPDPDDEDELISDEYFVPSDADDPDTEEVDEYKEATESGNIAGYKRKKNGHNIGKVPGTGREAINECGEDTYAYWIYRCATCKEAYAIRGFEPAAHKEHKADTYKKANPKLGQVKGEDIVYSIAVIGGKYVAISLGEDGKYYKYADATADNKGEYHIGALPTTGVYEYVECTDTIYTGKLCIYCGQFFCEDSEELEVEIAPKAHKDIDGNDIGVTCTTYDVEQAGAKCETCGKILPKIVVLDDEKNPGLKTITYYTAGGALLGKGQYLNNDTYFEVAHNWAVPQNDCEAINADIITCADCKISIKNEHAKVQKTDDNGVPVVEDGKPVMIDAPGKQHQYLTKTKVEGKFTTAAWDNEANINNGKAYFDNFIFFDVTYPTYLTEGNGVIYCEDCGKELKVVLNVVGAKATAEFDAEEPVIVGDVVSATISVSAKDFEFNTLEFAVTIREDLAKRIELVAAELVYEFDEIDAVTASVTADGRVVIRTPGVANRNVAVNGENVPFLKLYFKTGDITDAKEITKLEAVENVAAIKVACTKNTVIDDKDQGVDGKEFAIDAGLNGLEIYNPAYTVSAVSVLSQIYSTDYAVKFDFNRDGRVDLDDYFAMVDFVDSAKTIADFCTLTGYDVEAMLDGLTYETAIAYQRDNKTSVDPDGTMHVITVTKDSLKAVVRSKLASSNYTATIIGGGITIDEFAQNIINGYAL